MWERCDEARPPAGQDPDVVGLGTLIACAGSASVAVLSLVVQYLFFYLPRGRDEQQSPAANPIDVLLVGWLRKPLRYLGIRNSLPATPPRRERRWSAAFDRYVLALGDVQLAMGFAVLAYGYASLLEQGLSMYHWWLIVGLVWFSVVTNLATTSYLRAYFVNRDPGERWWRIILLIFLVAVLSFSMVPIYQFKERLTNEHDEDAQRRILHTTNALCYFPGHGTRFDTPHFLSGVTLVGIAVAVGMALFGLLWIYERPRSIIFKWRDHYRGEMEQSFFGDGGNIITCIRCEQRHLLLVVRPVLALWLVLRLYADLLNSVLTEIIYASATFTWVIVRFIDVLRLGGTFEVDSRHWNFGQIIALAFFAAPLGSLASCLCGTVGKLLFGGSDFFRLPKLQGPEWLRKFGQATPPEQTSETEADQHVVQPDPERTERTGGVVAKDQSATVESIPEVQELEGRINTETSVDDLSKSIDYVNIYKVLLSPRFVIALPVMGFSNLLHLVLLLALPKVPGYPSPPDVLWRTIFWYLVYQPLLVFAFFLAGMIVEERVTNERRMRISYLVIAAIAILLSTAAILDTLYGLGGIPMSYIGMGALGLVLLVYLLYGCVARPGPLAKGKGRRNGDVEEARPLLGGALGDVGRRFIPEIRIFPVRRPKRWHGPSRRPQVTRGRRGYGTID